MIATVNTPVVELSFKGRRRELYLNSDHLEYRTGEFLIVQAERGEDIGVVVLSSHPMIRGGEGASPTNISPRAAELLDQSSSEPDAGTVVASAPAPSEGRAAGRDSHHRDQAHRREGHGNRPDPRGGALKRILRRATMDEIARVVDLRKKEEDAGRSARKKILDHSLEMKLVDVEYQFDGNRITFYFTAEQRVDFRELVKDLAGVFRTRIELRQIGVRDESGRLGGVGVCGRPLCCTTWIREFAPITLKMAKEQNLSLSPSKLSGVCGRLKCCLRYEIEFYQQAQKIYPRLGAQLPWKGASCEVVKVDIFREGVWLLDSERESHWIPLNELPEIPREDRLSFKKKKSAGGQGGCGNAGAGGCGAGRGEARAAGGCGSGGGCGTSGGGCGTGRPRFQPRDPKKSGIIPPVAESRPPREVPSTPKPSGVAAENVPSPGTGRPPRRRGNRGRPGPGSNPPRGPGNG